MRIKKAERLNTVKEYYFSLKLKEIQDMRNNGIDVINLGIGSPDMPPSEEVVSRLITESGNKKNHAYQSYAGIPELKKAFVEWYDKFFNVPLSISEVLPLMGSKEGIMHVSLAFLNAGDKVLVPNPGYPTYSSVTNLIGAVPLYYDLTENNNWYPDFTEIEKNDLSQVKLMWVNYPNMPTGTRASKKLFGRLIEFGLKHNILIVNDNPYSFVLNDEQLSILSAEGAKEVALELNSLSKSHNMAGWRVGMVAGNSDYIKAVLQVKSNMDSGMFKPVQLAAVEALNLHAKWYEYINAEYKKRRKVVCDIFDKLGFEYDSNQVGMFVWAKISNEYDNAVEFSDLLLKEEAVFITPGTIFGSNGQKYVRVSLCSDVNTLKKSLKRINRFLMKVKVNI
jgi:aspartate/methionine/tyrosine aminotransferase